MAKNEPSAPRCLNVGVAFVPTAGTRPAPEVLVLELFRELFYENFSEGKEHLLTAGDEETIAGQRGATVLEIVRGRQRLQKGQNPTPFYSPAYPEQAETAWLRKQSDQVIRDHFLRGPLAEALKGCSGAELERWASGVIKSFRGTNSGVNGDTDEILWSLIKDRETPQDMISNQRASERLLRHVVKEPRYCLVPETSAVDPLAKRILDDFNVIVELEGRIARMQWIDLLKTFLRFSTSIWLLSHMRVMVLLHGWLMKAITEGASPGEDKIREMIRSRSTSLFHPTQEPSSERAEHVARFMKARVEAKCLLNKLGKFDSDNALQKRLTVRSRSSEEASISEILDLALACKDRLSTEDVPPYIAITREAENYASWYRPLKIGVGKNIDEFLRVLRRLAGDEFDQAYLESQEGNRVAGRARIFPGPALLRMVVLLSSRNEEARRDSSTSKLLLSDVEKHFALYGIDFSAAASSRPRMIESLQGQGLLRGSPDAGDSVEVSSPFPGGAMQ
jgi:hypothetical protein